MSESVEIGRDVGNVLDKYCARHGYYPRISVANGLDGRIVLAITPGYIVLTFVGSQRQQPPHTVYITRNAWVKLLRFALPLVKHQDRQFSVGAAIRRYSKFEKDLLAELRQQKRARK